MKALHAIIEIHWTPSTLMLRWAEGGRVELASIWLRDNLRADRDPGNGQRLIDVADLPVAPRIRHAALQGTAVRIEWEDEEQGASFDLDWLAAQAAAIAGERTLPQPRLWLEGGRLEAARDFASIPERRPARRCWVCRSTSCTKSSPT